MAWLLLEKFPTIKERLLNLLKNQYRIYSHCQNLAVKEFIYDKTAYVDEMQNDDEQTQLYYFVRTAD